VSIWTVGEFLNRVAAQTGGLTGWLVYAVYYVVPHVEIFDVRERVIHGWEPVPWIPVGLASAYALAYMALLLAASALWFRRKPLN
jgi:DMSO/TMAO reductase YedYZ heme-binding membrane subunit